MSIKVKILLVDDEPEIRRFLEVELTRQGYDIVCAETGGLGQRQLNAKPPDLVILDLGLPDMDGKEFIVATREWSAVPIIVLSARDQEDEKIASLEAGADDYLTKPFGAGELMARVRVALRHRKASNAPYIPFRHCDLQIDLDKRQVTLAGHEIKLTPTEYKLLSALASQPGRVVTQATLINAVWGKNSQGNSHYLRIYIQHLREKLKDDPLDPVYILTEPGIGYRLISDMT